MSKTRRISDITGILLLIAAAGVLIRSACLTVSSDIWFDELFTVELAKMKLPGLVSMASRDVHPPLYYLIVRAVYLVLNGGTGADVITAAKIASIIPYFLLFIYFIIFIRKRYGLLGAGLSYMLCIGAPNLSEYLVEARMYSWCAFCVCAMFMHAHASVEDAKVLYRSGNKSGKLDNNDTKYDIVSHSRTRYYVNLLAVLLYGICAMYLHYYSAIAAILIVIWLAVNTIISLHKIPIVLPICMAAGIAAYIPWLSIALSQAGAVKNDYWILPLTWRTFPGCIKYILLTETGNAAFNYVLAGLAGICLFVIVMGYIIVGLHKTRSYQATKEVADADTIGTDTTGNNNDDSLHNYKHEQVSIADVGGESNGDVVAGDGNDTEMSLHNNTVFNFPIGCLLISACTVLTGIIVSFLIRPVFVYRYMIPVLPLFWLGCGCMTAYIIDCYVNHNTALHPQYIQTDENHDRTIRNYVNHISQQHPDDAHSDNRHSYNSQNYVNHFSQQHPTDIQTDKNHIHKLQNYVNHKNLLLPAIIFSTVMAVTSFIDVKSFTGNEKFKAVKMEETSSVLADINASEPNTLIVCNFNQIQALMWHYLDNDSVLWGETEETLIAEICGRFPITMTVDPDELAGIVKGRGQDSFLFFGSFNARDEIIAEWEKKGYECELVHDSCFIERYYFNIYRISIPNA